MGSEFEKLIRCFLPEESFVNTKNSCSEKGKRVSVRKEQGDTVYCFDIKSFDGLPEGASACDCLFVCKSCEQSAFLVVLVELKGDDTKKAFAQIEKTARLLCTQSACNVAGHGKRKHRQHVSSASAHHDAVVLGVVAAPSGGNAGPMFHVERKRLRQQNIKLLDRQQPHTVFTIHDLYKLANNQD